MSADALAAAIKRIALYGSLDADTLRAAFGVIMRGEGTAVQVAALLMALRVKGETAEEVAGVVQALRDAMVVLPADDAADLVDTCGTGGGSLTTFNISTAAALVAAGMGVRVAKHGNRSFTSRSGSADVLEALGVVVETTPTAMADTLQQAGIVFMFAPLMHPALRHVGPIRRELAVPTVMNIVGPLANPARAGRQVVGVAERARLDLLADTLRALGTTRAMVVHGAPGLDEISPLGITEVREVRGGSVTSWAIDPAAHGIASIATEELAGGDPAENAAVIEAVLNGNGPAGARAAVLLNAAAALYVSSDALGYDEAVRLTRVALDGGAGRAALDRLRQASRAAAGRWPRHA
ncbi:anthranilate phosphoribosyltransferase [Gemmatimonas sp.]|jgi:anthranilate phosphoribosyltransferase|uniref:anthranilate phosphoribosyltransferase n=1 Tax=Gemmatimonas sp. TaxID=1962908 RepID=UPI0027B8B6A0|nr:anthranilate phosphoribosyltransferase [Gemmatimonas sp.]